MFFMHRLQPLKSFHCASTWPCSADCAHAQQRMLCTSCTAAGCRTAALRQPGGCCALRSTSIHTQSHSGLGAGQRPVAAVGVVPQAGGKAHDDLSLVEHRPWHRPSVPGNAVMTDEPAAPVAAANCGWPAPAAPRPAAATVGVVVVTIALTPVSDFIDPSGWC